MKDFTKSNCQHKWVKKIQTKNRQRQTQRFCRRNAKPWKKTLRISSSFVVMLMSSPLRSTYHIDDYHRYLRYHITWFSPFWRFCHSTNDRALTATSQCIWTWRKGDVYGAFTNLDIFKWLNILFDWVYRTDATTTGILSLQEHDSYSQFTDHVVPCKDKMFSEMGVTDVGGAPSLLYGSNP